MGRTIFTFGFKTLTNRIYYVKGYSRSDALKILKQYLKLMPTVTVVYCKPGMIPHLDGIKTIN